MTPPRFIVTGTDTDIGKTVFAAALAQAIGAHYWKPVQSGVDVDGDTDSLRIARLAALPPERVHGEAYRLSQPLSPHRAAELDGVAIDMARIIAALPDPAAPLVVEGAGGLMVPVTRDTTMLDLFAAWQIPVILCARTALGTINHSLLSLAALRARGVPVHGMAFIGDDNADNIATIAAMGDVRVLGRLPRIDPLTPATLAAAFADHFDVGDFR